MLNPIPTEYETGGRLADQLEEYLGDYFGKPVEVLETAPLGEDAGAKGFGYGVPIHVRLAGAPIRDVVVHRTGSAGFGHDSLSDRAVQALQPYDTFNSLPQHVPALDVGIIHGDGQWASLRGVRDFFFVTGYARGEPYYKDLERIGVSRRISTDDMGRLDALIDTLVGIHARAKDAPELYRRRTRDLFGHHECIAGLLDSYDDYSLEGFTTPQALIAIEERGVRWRQRLKPLTHRLRRAHGDFHPWNVLFDSGGRLTLLDRSRGEWGDPADDLSCMTINLLFFALRNMDGFHGPLRQMWGRFFARYLESTGDHEILTVIPPYFAWRALVVASPLWYPDLDVAVRRRLFRFIDNVLDLERFDWRRVDQLIEE